MQKKLIDLKDLNNPTLLKCQIDFVIALRNVKHNHLKKQRKIKRKKRFY